MLETLLSTQLILFISAPAFLFVLKLSDRAAFANQNVSIQGSERAGLSDCIMSFYFEQLLILCNTYIVFYIDT